MFIQIMEGHINDADGLDRQMERWIADLRPGATGFVGVTAGVTADGTAISLVRFESEESARANSDRPEQGEWWAETEKYYDGEVSFDESSDVTEWLGGGSNDAGFVQVMKSTGVDRSALERMDSQLEGYIDARPDAIGGYRAWLGPDRCVEVAYFTSEAEAREGEKAEMPAEMQAAMAEFDSGPGEVEFLDLVDPILH